MKIYFVSLGCPKNLSDTEVLMGKLVAGGHTITTNPAEAEIIIINTCAFLKSARDEAEATIREMAQWKKKGKCQKIYLAGCLPEYLKKVGGKGKGEKGLVDGDIDSIGLFSCETPRIKATPPWYAYVKIAEGCNNNCAYCLIPTIRGRMRCRKPADILNEVKALSKRGVKEIIFIAQDTTAYPNFHQLLKKTAKIKGIRWIRIMYTHPSHITDKLIEEIAKEKKIVKYLDLPIQHACDKILRRMNRRYTRQDLENLISKIRRKIPKIALRTSVIVGFPGENDADFEELKNFIRQVKFDKIGVFTYQREKGTSAFKQREQVSEKVKQKRFDILMRLASRESTERNIKLIGSLVEIIIEGAENGYFVGRSSTDAPEIDGKIFLKKSKSLKPGKIARAKITGARTYDLIGCLT
ncbi:MAG: 30S ribosomal protein S12 methylthiotransferase RimO [Candidatus Margulisiibacteriota bacterium]